nr:serine/threonine-protein kinase STN7, chloroplastic [Ipomoea batatas]
MAAAVSTGSGVQLHTLKNPVIKPSSLSSFLGKKLAPRFKPFNFTARPASRSRNHVVLAVGGESFSFLHDVFLGVGVGLPCTVMQCGDIIYRSTLPKSTGLTITVPGVILALGTLSYLWATPGVAPGFFDMFVLAFVERLYRPSFKKDDIVLGKKLGEGSFGSVYRVSLANKPSKPKDGDLVLKKATEYGAVEIWMNERARRACANSCADFLYGFLESSSKKGAEYWLIWRFEGESTLADFMQSKEFPYNVSNFFILCFVDLQYIGVQLMESLFDIKVCKKVRGWTWGV